MQGRYPVMQPLALRYLRTDSDDFCLAACVTAYQ